MNLLSQALISGLISGTVYALLGTGLIIAFQTTRIVNLAHGETYAISGLITAALAHAGVPLALAVVAGIAAAVLYSVALERVLLRPRANWPVSGLILVSLAAAFLSRGVLQVAFGVNAASFSRLFIGTPIRIAGGVLPQQGLWLVILGCGAVFVTTLVLMRTGIGQQLRATAENADAAQLLGVDVGRSRTIAFAIAGTLGGLSAALLVPLVSVDYQAGLGMTLRGFIAASLGGMSPLSGIFGGLGLGLAEALVTTYFGALAQDPVIFLVLIGVALWQSRKIRFGGSLRMKRGHILPAVLLLLAVASPYAGFIPGWSPALATNVALTALALIGLNLIFGVTGMLAFGQAAFMVVPAYLGGILERAGLGAWFAIGIGLVVAVLLARVLGEFFVRLPGVYLAFGTLGFGYVVEGLARAFPSWTGGASGLVFSAGRAIGQNAWYAIAIAALALGLAIYARAMQGANWRRLRTIRHDELVAAVLGIDVTRVKVRTFTVGCLYAAVAGTLLCYYVGVVVPDDASAQRSLSQIGMVMMGGPALTFGPVVGAFLVAWLFFVAGYGGQFESLVYGIVFLLAVLYAKNGLLGFFRSPERSPGPAVRGVAGADAAGVGDAAERTGICLRVDDVAKHFQGLVALEDVSFEVAAGEVFALVGPNGAGKSTLFNVICGIIDASSGRVELLGRDLAAVPLHRRAALIGRAFQVARLIPELTATENVMVRIDNIAPELSEVQRLGEARAQLEAFDLAQHADAAVNTLSIGQHKLIDLARASVGNPPLVLLDEPAVGLTEPELLHLRDVILKLRTRGTAVVIVEHNIDFVSSVATRGMVLDSGRVVTSGPMREILADERVQSAYFGALT